MQTIATVCMFLAGKVEETVRPLRDVVLLSYEIINKKDPAAFQRIRQKEVYEQQKELILLGERVVLVTLGFELNIDHRYKPLVEAIGRFKVAQSALVQVASNFVNDGLRTSLCLQFKPHQIAAGAIFMAAKFLKIKLPSGGEKVWWQGFDVTPRHLEEISNQILELYEQNIVAPPPLQGNDTDRSPASVSNQRTAGKAPTAHEPQASRQLSHQNVPGHHGYDHAHPEKQHPNQRTPRNEARDSIINSNDGPKISSSMMDAMRKIDKDKVKAALEKRRKSKGDVPRKVDIMDDDHLIERELEHGVELAAEGEKIKQERRQSWPHPAHREDSLKAAHMIENTEEGELSTDKQGHRSLDRKWNYDRGERDIKRLRS
ncbi:unnamed protein product [Miscanthus lutarioriparius]|uniref:Cyclin-like domain-containing protein n=1 Tax=Miscanthus lutarioriparius TaxID=422564 RepID=A0A811S4L5_9POAL|nr:unnamed protein product [Miscanthus lutarioriparius]